MCAKKFKKNSLTQEMPSKGHRNGERHISAFFQLFSVFEAHSLSDKRMKMLDTFYIAFKDNIAVSKAKLI